MIPVLPHGIESRAVRELWAHFKTKKSGLFNETETAWDIICLANADKACSQLTCIIDGLDECTDKCPKGQPHGCSNKCPGRSRSYFVAKLAQLSTMTTERKTAPKFFVTSRPDPQIEAGFSSMSGTRLRLEDEERNTARDVSLVILAGVDRLITGPNDYEEGDRNFLFKEMTDRSGQTFLWVDLVFRELENAISVNEETMKRIIGTRPRDLDKRYEDELSHSKNPERARRVLQLIIGSSTPLSLEELNIAFNIGPEARMVRQITLERNIESHVKQLCGFLVRISGGRLYLFHDTTREFLVKSESSDCNPDTWKHSIDLSVANRVLATSCARYLLLQDWRELIKVPSSWLEDGNGMNPAQLQSSAKTVEIEWYYILPHVLNLLGFEDSFFQYALQALPDLTPGTRRIEQYTVKASRGTSPWLKLITYMRSTIWSFFTLPLLLRRKSPDVGPYKPNYSPSYSDMRSTLSRSRLSDIADIDAWLQSVGGSSTISGSGKPLTSRGNFHVHWDAQDLLGIEQIVERSLDFYKLPRPHLWFSVPYFYTGTDTASSMGDKRQFIRGAIMLAMLQERIVFEMNSLDGLESNLYLPGACLRALESLIQPCQKNRELAYVLDPHWYYLSGDETIPFREIGWKVPEDWSRDSKPFSNKIQKLVQRLTGIRTPLFTNIVKGNGAIVRRLLDDPSLQSEHELLDDIITALTWKPNERDFVLFRTILDLRRKFFPERPVNGLLQEAINWKRFCLLPLYVTQEGTNCEDTNHEIVVQALAEGHAGNEEGFVRQMNDLGLKLTALGPPHQNIAIHLCLGMRLTDPIVKTVGLLLEGEIDPNTRDSAGMSPLDTMTVLAPTKESAAIVGLLVRYGAKLNETGPNGCTPLQNATGHEASEGVLETAKHLLNNDSDVTAMDLSDLPLSNDLSSLEKLIENLIEKNVRARRTPLGEQSLLHKLVALRDCEELPRIIDTLIYEGEMDPSIKDDNGETALEYGMNRYGITNEDVFRGKVSLPQKLQVLCYHPSRIIRAPTQQEIKRANKEDIERLKNQESMRTEQSHRSYSFTMSDISTPDIDDNNNQVELV